MDAKRAQTVKPQSPRTMTIGVAYRTYVEAEKT